MGRLLHKVCFVNDAGEECDDEATFVDTGDVYHGALDLVVIDEAHHLHSDGMLELIIKHYVKMESTTKLILLSDASQSGAIEMALNLRAAFGGRNK